MPVNPAHENAAQRDGLDGRAVNSFVLNREKSMQTVLIIDDAKENIMILSRLLKEQAHIIFATNGEDGLVKAEKQSPDLILLDISMPEMDGFDVLGHLKSNPQTVEIPVIIVTGIPDTDTEERGLNAGAIDYVTKPFAPAVVKARVRNQLQLRCLTKELLQANVELTRMAMTDALTGIYNRRHFMHAASHELKRLKDGSPSAGMMMLDIDHFKNINDRYGHDTGDRVLVHATGTAKTLLRKDDVFGRFGGEEFSILVPRTTLEDTGLIARRICSLLASSPLADADEEIGFTASFGVTGLRKEDCNCEQALKRADIALYEAKNSGRNQVVVHE